MVDHLRARACRSLPVVITILGLVVFLAGCGSAATSPKRGANASGAVDAAAQDATCAAPVAGRSVPHTVTVEGRQRGFIEHVPDGITTGGPRPVVLAFPGRGESAEQLEGYSGLDAANVIVLYLQGLPGRHDRSSWEASPYLDASAHDYEFVSDLVGWVRQASCADRTRIDLVGKSDGAGFAASAACSMPDIAAVATISGAFYSAHTRCASTGTPVALLNMHGTADPVIAYAGDARRGLLGTDAWVSLWNTRDRCSGPPATTGDPGDLQWLAWNACADGTAVVSYQLIGGGHTWPGAKVRSGPGPTSTAVDATQAVIAFFVDHPRPGDAAGR